MRTSAIGFDVEPGGNLGLADPFVTGDVEHDRSLPAGDRQSGLSRPPLEAPLEQPGNIVH